MNCEDCGEIKVLTCLRKNETGMITDTIGRGSGIQRIRELGLVRGTKVTMIKNDTGPIIIRVFGNKLALGYDLAEKIIINIVQ